MRIRPSCAFLLLLLASAGCGGRSGLGAPAEPDAEAEAGVPVDAGQPVLDGATPADAGAPAAEIVYVATFLDGLSALTISPDGALAPVAGSPVDPGGALYAAALDPSGAALYAVDTNDNQILGYRTAPSGALAALPGFPIATGVGPVSIAIDPQRRFAYVGTSDPKGSLYVYTMSPDGRLSPTTASPYVLHGATNYIAADPSGRFVYAKAFSGIHVYSVAAATGDLTEIAGSPFAVGLGREALVFHPGGKLLFSGGGGLNVFAVDGATGALTLVPGSPFTMDVASDQFSTDVALDPAGRFVYAVSSVSGHLSAYAIDPASGALTAVAGSPFDAGPSAYSVAVDPAGRFVYVGNDDANQVSGFAIDPASGAVHALARSPFPVTGLQPELVVGAR